MPRPQRNRSVHKPPVFSEFKPMGINPRMLGQTTLSLDEYEAFRLADSLGLSHAEAAEEMEISRPTFTRLIEQARKKISELIIDGNILTIEGGNIHFKNNIIKCNSCGHMFNININATISECPECNSRQLVNLAGGFGHGKCCRNRNNNKKGGYYARR
jgi:predicted DNA-binding protein (UPF0251 family)